MKQVQCDKCCGQGKIDAPPLYAKHIWVREPDFDVFDSKERVVIRTDVANCYARQGSHWIKYTASDEDIYPEDD